MFIRRDLCFVIFFLEVIYCLCHGRHLLWDDFVTLWTIFVLYLHHDLRVVTNHISLYTEHIHTHEVYVRCGCMRLISKLFSASELIRVISHTELQLQYHCEVYVHFANMKVDVDEKQKKKKKKKEQAQLELSSINSYSPLN